IEKKPPHYKDSLVVGLLADDGKLSMEEFQSYFTDGVLTDEQMQELYYSIDRQQTDNLDIDKLSEYFTPHLGEYVNVLSALEKLNVAILKAMDKTKEEYQGSSVLGQFVTRFLLRETTSQLQSLQFSLDCATEAVHDHGCTGRRTVKKPEDLPIQRVAKRPSRRIQKNMCLSPTDPYSGIVEPDNHWGSQINQLEELMDKLDCEVGGKISSFQSLYCSVFLVFSSKSFILYLVLCAPFFFFFLNFQLDYTNIFQAHRAASKFTLKYTTDSFHLFFFFFFFSSYLQSSISKTFQRCIIDSLEEPEIVSTMLLPGTNWQKKSLLCSLNYY
uniref:N-terminal EF-hand calcium binding protein 3 n=1 Tax=Poecilia mexicana TaxID=48701 RepID=A0A3B3Y880_9TELE